MGAEDGDAWGDTWGCGMVTTPKKSCLLDYGVLEAKIISTE